MRCLGPLLLLGAGVYMIYRGRRFKEAEDQMDGPEAILGQVPDGTVPTGRRKTTKNSSTPTTTDEVLAYVIRDWAEVIFPDGTADWVEIDRRSIF